MTLSDYSAVTEKAGDWVTPEAVSMVYTRYRFASDFCRGRRVLEIACGPGVGLGYLARHAEDVIGGDLTHSLLQHARDRVQESISLLRLEAEELPLLPASRDLIVCCEALYFLRDPGQFLQECRRVLSPQGLLLLCTVNPEWPDFNPSPYGRQYYSTRALVSVMREAGFQTEMYAAFPVVGASLRASCVSWIKRVAVALHLIPASMAGKRLLKRFFLGGLVPFPTAVDDGLATYVQPVGIPQDQPVPGYKILFAVGRPV